MPINRSKIGWTDYSGGDLNFVIGCTPISAGCKNCYAKALIENRQGRDFSKIRVYPEKLERLKTAKFDPGDKPYRRGNGSKPLVFVCDLSDLFHHDIRDNARFEFFDIVRQRQDVVWQVLTKRIDNAYEFFNVYYSSLPSNLFIGATIENEKQNYNRVSYLELIKKYYPNVITFISAEPLLEEITFTEYDYKHIDWFIVGGESGNNRRHFDKGWARQIRDDCKKYGVPFFFKQGSHRYPSRDDLLDGEKYKEFPVKG